MWWRRPRPADAEYRPDPGHAMETVFGGPTLNQELLTSRGGDTIEVYHLKQVLTGLLETMQEFADCDFYPGNCSSLEVATVRIRKIARAAITKATK